MADSMDLSYESDLNELRVVDLKKELENRGLAKSGTKKELIDRLKQHLKSIESTAEKKVSDDEGEEDKSRDSEKSDSDFDPSRVQQDRQPTNGQDLDTPSDQDKSEIERSQKKLSQAEEMEDSRDSSIKRKSRSHSSSSSSSGTIDEEENRGSGGGSDNSSSDDERVNEVRRDEGQRRRSRSRSPEVKRSRSRTPEVKDTSASKEEASGGSATKKSGGHSGEEEEKKEEPGRRKKTIEGITSESQRPAVVEQKPEENKEKSAETSSITVNKNEDSSSSVEKPLVANTEESSAVDQSTSKPAKKRRWGSTSTAPAKSIFNISTESLKGLIPEIKLSTLDKQEPLNFILEEGENSASDFSDVETKRRHVEDEEAGGDRLRLSPPRRVKEKKSKNDAETEDGEVEEGMEVDLGTKTVELVSELIGADDDDDDKSTHNTSAADKDDQENREPVRGKKTTQRQDSSTVGGPGRLINVLPKADEPTPVRRGSPSPPRHPPSTVLHVRGLVRPYTLNQLRELLSRTGVIAEDGFWIDKIKSHCYVVYGTVEEATATRKALHGKKWPLSNPKILCVDFASTEDFERVKDLDGEGSSAAATKPAANVARRGSAAEELLKNKERRQNREPEARDTKESRVRDDRKEKSSAVKPLFPVREWDRDKRRQSRSRSRSQGDRGRRDRERDERRKHEDSREDRHREREGKKGAEKAPEEPPAKLLDDLFRKTKTLPCIYWLPLTEEQIAAKEAAVAEIEAQRARNRAEREQQKQVEAERGRHQRQSVDRRGGDDTSRDRKHHEASSKHRDESPRRGHRTSGGASGHPTGRNESSSQRGHSRSRRERVGDGRH